MPFTYEPAIDWTYTTTHEFNGIPFTITIDFLGEDTPLEDTFDNAIDNLPDLRSQISNGDLQYFCAKVTASYHDLDLSSSYLGCCLYDTYGSFLNEPNGYYRDMLIETCTEAYEKLTAICKSIHSKQTE